MPTILKTTLSKNYKTASPFSRAFLLAIVSLATLLIVPFILAYVSTNFWIKYAVYLERPSYQFTKCAVYVKARTGTRLVNSFRMVRGDSRLDKYSSKDLFLTLETLAPAVDDSRFSFHLSGQTTGAVESVRIVLEFDLGLRVFIALFNLHTIGKVRI